MITVLVTLTPTPGREDDLRAGLAHLLGLVREEPGCAAIHWGPVAGDAQGRIAIVERYRDQAALEAHHASAHMAEVGPGVMALCAGAPEATVFHEI